MKKAAIFCLSLFSFFHVVSQNEKEVQENRHALKSANISVKSEVVYSRYANLENEISNNLIKKQIPSGFPEFDSKAETIDAYRKRIDAWYMSNTEFLNPEFRNKITAEKQN